MSRSMLLVGLIVSLAAHAVALRWPAPAAAPVPSAPAIAAARPAVVPVLSRPSEPPAADVAPPSLDAPPDPVPAPREPEPVAERPVEASAAPEPASQDPPAADDPPAEAAPSLERVAEEASDPGDARGDLAGSAQGRSRPVLRFDWGDADHARAVVEVGGMLMVVLAPGAGGPIILDEVVADGRAWRRRPFHPPAGPVRYANRLRIVDDVPAFAGVQRSAGLGAGERLAVLVPVELERRFDAAQIEAAFTRGLAMSDIRAFAARFAIDGAALRIEITHVGEDS